MRYIAQEYLWLECLDYLWTALMALGVSFSMAFLWYELRCLRNIARERAELKEMAKTCSNHMAKMDPIPFSATGPKRFTVRIPEKSQWN